MVEPSAWKVYVSIFVVIAVVCTMYFPYIFGWEFLTATPPLDSEGAGSAFIYDTPETLKSVGKTAHHVVGRSTFAIL